MSINREPALLLSKQRLRPLVSAARLPIQEAEMSDFILSLPGSSSSSLVSPLALPDSQVSTYSCL